MATDNSLGNHLRIIDLLLEKDRNDIDALVLQADIYTRHDQTEKA